MKSRRLAFVLAASGAVLAMTASLVSAKPVVTLRLEGSLIEHRAHGQDLRIPLGKAAIHPGDVVHWDLVATNTGDSVAHRVIPIGKIPSGAAYVPGSASSGAQFSLDDGKTWAVFPTVTVHTPNGDVRQVADPTRYTAIRWVSEDLAPHAAVRFAYDARVQ